MLRAEYGVPADRGVIVGVQSAPYVILGVARNGGLLLRVRPVAGGRTLLAHPEFDLVWPPGHRYPANALTPPKPN